MTMSATILKVDAKERMKERITAALPCPAEVKTPMKISHSAVQVVWAALEKIPFKRVLSALRTKIMAMRTS